MFTLSNVENRRGETSPPSVRLTPDAYPEAKSSKTGVSVRYASDPNKKWYVFRASYGRENKAFDVIVEDGSYCYIGKKYVRKTINGKQKKLLVSLIPNLLFVYTTEEKAKQYINKASSLSYLAFCYNRCESDEQKKNPYLIVPNHDMEMFIMATQTNNEHIMLVEESQCHYKGGETVVVVEGDFKGCEGKVARVAGQQRVIISITNIGLISTAYIPSAFLRLKNS